MERCEVCFFDQMSPQIDWMQPELKKSPTESKHEENEWMMQSSDDVDAEKQLKQGA